jgi:aldehyde dehydrogenase (NAD+)
MNNQNAPAPFAIQGHQYINGRWQPGRSTKRLDNRNPFNNELLLDMPLASVADLDEAYLAAEKAQLEWAALHAGQRVMLLEKLAVIVAQRSEEIIDWLIKESGSTRINLMD